MSLYSLHKIPMLDYFVRVVVTKSLGEHRENELTPELPVLCYVFTSEIAAQQLSLGSKHLV